MDKRRVLPCVLGSYTLDYRLATGGMAEVFVAHRPGPYGFQKQFALKRILPQYVRDPDYVAMFIAEANVAAELNHPNIVQVFEFGETEAKELFLVMELVVGSHTHHLVRALERRKKALPLDLALHIGRQTAHALAYAHGQADAEGKPLGIVHRDVSPANILLSETGHVKLADFGIARIAGVESRTGDGQIRGKLGYMSPEQVTGQELDGRSDVFTLCSVLAEILIGEPLFGSGEDLDILLRIRDSDLSVLEASRRRLPKDVLDLVREGLRPNRAHRPTSKELTASLDDLMRRRGIARGPERLARLLQRLELVRGRGRKPSLGPKPTALFDTTGVDVTGVDTARLGEGGEGNEKYLVKGLESPMSFAHLIAMITTGRLKRDSLISKPGAKERPAIAWPELERFVTSSAIRWEIDDLRSAKQRGTLASASLLPLVHRLGRASETGALYLTDRDRRKKIYFVDGRPDFVASTDPNELLGEHLVRTGVCLPMEVDMALAVLPKYGGRLGDALSALGVLRPVELARAVSEQVRHTYLEAFRWRSGTYAFIQGAKNEEATFPLGHDPAELLRDAAREAHPAELEAALRPVQEQVLRQTRNPPTAKGTYRLPEAWNQVLQVSGDRTLSSLVSRAISHGVLDIEEAYRAFYFGLSCELVEAA